MAFEMKNAHPHDVATIIDRSGVAVRAGTHCVMPLLARFGVTATCRASLPCTILTMRSTALRTPHQGTGVLRMTDDVKDDPDCSRR